jgi:hypothetical protein
MQAMLFVCEKWAREYRVIFSLKKCEIVEYCAVLTDRVKEWDLQGGKVLEVKVYKYLGMMHAADFNGRVRRRIGQIKHVVLNESLQLQANWAISWHSDLYFLSAGTCALVCGGKKMRKEREKKKK